MSYPNPNVINLGVNGTLPNPEYIIDGAVIAQPVSSFAEGIRTSSPDFDSVEHVFYKGYEDFSGGIGVRHGNRQDLSVLWRSTNVRTWDAVNDIRLGPLETQVTIGAIVPSFVSGSNHIAAIEAFNLNASSFKRVLWAAIGNTVMRRDDVSTTWTVDNPSPTPSFNTTFALYPWTNTSGSPGLFWAGGHQSAFIWAETAGQNFYRRNMGGNLGTTASWEQPSAGEFAHDFIEFDSKLLKIYFGAIKSSTDGVTWTSLLNITSAVDRLRVSKWVGIAQTAAGELMPYCLRNGNLYVVDIFSRQYSEVTTGLVKDTAIDAVLYGDEIVITDGINVKLYHPLRPIRDIGLTTLKNDVNVSIGQVNFFPRFRKFVVVGKYLVAYMNIQATLVSETSLLSQLWLWDAVAWHMVDSERDGFISGHPNGGRAMAIFNGNEPFDAEGQYWVFTINLSNVVKTWQLPTANHFLKPDSTQDYEYALNGSIITPWFDGGFADMEGTALSLSFFTNRLTGSTGERIDVSYQLDYDEDTTFDCKTVVTSPREDVGIATETNFILQGVTFKAIRFILNPTRTSGDSSSSPEIRSFLFKYIKRPDARFRYDINIDVTRTAEHRGVSKELIIEELTSYISSNPLLRLDYVGEPSRYVYVVAEPRRDLLEPTGDTRTSIVKLQLIQPVRDIEIQTTADGLSGDGNAYHNEILAKVATVYMKLGETSGDYHDSANAGSINDVASTTAVGASRGVHGKFRTNDNGALLAVGDITVISGLTTDYDVGSDGSFGMTMWIKPRTTEAGTDRVIYSRDNSGPEIGIGTDNKVFVRINGGATIVKSTSTITADDLSWYMIAVVNEGTTTSWKIYINGANVTDTVTTPTSFTPNASSVAYLGSEDNQIKFAGGVIDEFAWRPALWDAQAILDLYNVGTGQV